MQKSVDLGDFINNEMASILADWDEFAETINPSLMMNREALRDHAQQMLATIAKDLATHQSSEKQEEKSKGNAPRENGCTAAEVHAEGRLASGFTIDQLFSEYRALRASVLRRWEKYCAMGLTTDPVGISRFNEAIDQAIAESLARYSILLKTSQSMFLAILGHDLRSPLSTTIMTASSLMRANVHEKSTVAATRIFNTAHRMTTLVDDLIDFTRTQLGGKLPITLAKSDLSKICADAVEEQRIANPHSTILMQADGSFDSILDRNRIAQVMSNLLGNAIQHGTAAGPVAVTLKSSQDTVSIAVANDGRAIPKEKLAQIFEPLVRFAENEHREASHQTSLGIGLYIAREIVLAHQGSIDVSSSPSGGTVFEISLPRHPT